MSNTGLKARSRCPTFFLFAMLFSGGVEGSLRFFRLESRGEEVSVVALSRLCASVMTRACVLSSTVNLSLLNVPCLLRPFTLFVSQFDAPDSAFFVFCLRRRRSPLLSDRDFRGSICVSHGAARFLV